MKADTQVLQDVLAELQWEPGDQLPIANASGCGHRAPALGSWFRPWPMC